MVTSDDVRARLARVRYPGFARDILALGVVEAVAVDAGRITVTLKTGTAKPEVLRAIRDGILEQLRDIPSVQEIAIVDASAEPGPTGRGSPFDERAALPGVARILAVASAKGGVGKSTVAVNLALALRDRGLRVGLLDADIYGPSVPFMMGVEEASPGIVESRRIAPVTRHGVALISMGLFVDETTPVIWRGPMVMSIVRQFLTDVEWGELDVLVVDLPPGTGDAQLTVMQQVPLAGGVIVTTPQDVALQDVRRGIAMFEAVKTPVLGIIENMSGYVCPQCGAHEETFGAGGGQRESGELGVAFLGRIPLLAEVGAAMDRGQPLVLGNPSHPVAGLFATVAERLVSALRIPGSDPVGTASR